MTDEEVFELVRFAVPAAWSDWAVDRLAQRLAPHEYVDKDGKCDICGKPSGSHSPPTMPRGLTHEERRSHHATAPHGPPRQAT